jgi:hypothetical protein
MVAPEGGSLEKGGAEGRGRRGMSEVDSRFPTYKIELNNLFYIHLIKWIPLLKII